MSAQIYIFPTSCHVGPRQHVCVDGSIAMLGAIVNGKIQAWKIIGGEVREVFLEPDAVYMKQWEKVYAGEGRLPARFAEDAGKPCDTGDDAA